MPLLVATRQREPVPPWYLRNQVQLGLQIYECVDPLVKRKPMSEARNVPRWQIQCFVNETVVHIQGAVILDPGPEMDAARPFATRVASAPATPGPVPEGGGGATGEWVRGATQP
eukprot:596149-Pyramimonas_sp.AAC.1